MLILPIVNRNRVMNVQIKIKNAEKIKTGVRYSDCNESDIIVNREKFSESDLYHSDYINAPIDFIRSRSLISKKNYLVSTKERADSKYYDLYEVHQPLNKVNDELDGLYCKALTDMRKEVPGNNRGRYISFKDLGIDKDLTDEKIATIQRIIKEESDQNKWPLLFHNAGVSSLKDTIDFISCFDAKIIKDTTIPEDSISDVLKALEVINTRDSRNLRKYYQIALDNKEIYAKLSYLNKIIYDKPFLIKTKNEKNKMLIKHINESEKNEYDKCA